MKKYILIQNDGEIETNSFELIGASTKRGDKGKIGFFGSGLKYSIAYMMRNSIDFKIFSGENEMVFTTIDETLKDQVFQRICINGKPTSYTVTMGATWTEDWFVLREIYCNAIDEGTCQLVRETEIVQPAAGKTRIYVELTEKLNALQLEWDSYFTEDREPLFVANKIYTCYLSSEGGVTEQKVKVLQKTKGVLFRRGIRVSHHDKMLYDYDVDFVDINEDRTAKSPNAMTFVFCDLFAQFINEDWVKNVLRSGKVEKSDVSWEYDSIDTESRSAYSTEWIRFSNENLLVVEEISGKFSEEISKSKREVFLIPSRLARFMKVKLPAIVILGMGTSVDNTFMTEMEPTAKMSFLLKEVLASLSEMKYEVPYDITVVQFENPDVLGKADVNNKKIYIGDRTFDMGRREIALTLMEETEHIKAVAMDETRRFQNHIFSQWLTALENQNGLFL